MYLLCTAVGKGAPKHLRQAVGGWRSGQMQAWCTRCCVRRSCCAPLTYSSACADWVHTADCQAHDEAQL